MPLYYPHSASLFAAHPKLHLFWRLLPIESIILWGIYAALSVLNAVKNVKDYPEAKMSLLEDIKKAKEQLSKSGFDWN